jgi:hypothetical protein
MWWHLTTSGPLSPEDWLVTRVTTSSVAVNVRSRIPPTLSGFDFVWIRRATSKPKAASKALKPDAAQGRKLQTWYIRQPYLRLFTIQR